MDGEAVESALQSLVDDGHGPGVFGLVSQDGRPVFQGGAGVADLVDGRPITADDRFRVGSVTKTYVAALVLLLEADGVLGTGDSVTGWLPEYDLAPELTVAHLLRLRSGIPDYVPALVGDPPDPDRAVEAYRRYHPPAELVALAESLPGRGAPGQRFRYSNTDYLLLGLVVERATGQRLDAQLWQRVLQPLGLRDTELPAVDPVLRGRHATGYTRLVAGAPYLETTEITPSESGASGAIVSTPGEVARFLDAVLGGRLLPEPQLRMLRDARPVDDGRAYGCGLYRVALPDGPVLYGHQGGTAGYNCLAATTATGRTLVLYQNSYDVTALLRWDNRFVRAALAGAG